MGRCWGNRKSNRNSPELEIPLTPVSSATYIFLIATNSRIIVPSGHSLRRFLIAKPKIRNCPNSRLFNALDFSNREKSCLHHLAAAGPFLASLPPWILASLIYTPKIRNRRNPHRISSLHFSNRGSDKASASRANNVSRGTSLPFLIYTENIRNPRNLPRISHLHFSNLYKIRAFFSRRASSFAVAAPPARRHNLPLDILPEAGSVHLECLPKNRKNESNCFKERSTS